MIAYIEAHFNPSGAVDSLGYIFNLIDIRQAADELIVTLKARFLRVFASLKIGGISIDSALQVREFHLRQHSLTTASLQTVIDQSVSYGKDPWKGLVGRDGVLVSTSLVNATNSDPGNSLYAGMAAKPFNFTLVIGRRLFCTRRANASSVSTLLRTTPTTRHMAAPS
jgi:hypothetical protein